MIATTVSDVWPQTADLIPPYAWQPAVIAVSLAIAVGLILAFIWVAWLERDLD